MSIFDDMAADHGWTPDQPAAEPAAILGVDDTQWLPIVRPMSGAEADELVTPTWNGLRPEDAALEQPPQDPEWRPDADR